MGSGGVFLGGGGWWTVFVRWGWVMVSIFWVVGGGGYILGSGGWWWVVARFIIARIK